MFFFSSMSIVYHLGVCKHNKTNDFTTMRCYCLEKVDYEADTIGDTGFLALFKADVLKLPSLTTWRGEQRLVGFNIKLCLTFSEILYINMVILKHIIENHFFLHFVNTKEQILREKTIQTLQLLSVCS